MSSSAAQVTAIMEQMRAISSLEAHDQWFVYVRILSYMLQGMLDDKEAVFDCLEMNLPSPPAMQAFHDMLMEELIEDRARTLPAMLVKVYPWNKMAADVIDAFIAFSQWRERAMSRIKDEPAACSHAAAICREVLGRYEDKGVSLLDDDPLAVQLQQLSISSRKNNI
jgi:hypothetical protein